MFPLLQFAVKSRNSTGSTEKHGSMTLGQDVIGVPLAGVVFVNVTPE